MENNDTSDSEVDMYNMECSESEEINVLCEVPTENRFDGLASGRGTQWKTKQSKKRKKVSSSGSMDTSNFDGLSNGDKLSRLFETVLSNKEMLSHISHEQTRYHKITEDLRENVAKLYERTERAERRVNQQALFMKTLAYRSIDTEARSRRNNVIIWGVTERSRTSIETLVLNFLEDLLEIDTSYMVIDRAHRMGSIRNRSSDDQKRPIIVRFRDYNDTETIMRKAYKLKGSPFGLDRDYPMEIATARKELYKSPAAQEARAARKKIQIKYPAKLYIDNKLITDTFPEWHSALKADRIACLEERNDRQNDRSRQQIEDDAVTHQRKTHNEYDNDTEVDSVSESSSENVFLSVKSKESDKIKSNQSSNTERVNKCTKSTKSCDRTECTECKNSTRPKTVKSRDESTTRLQQKCNSVSLPKSEASIDNSGANSTKQREKSQSQKNSSRKDEPQNNNKHNPVKRGSADTHSVTQSRVNKPSINRTVENQASETDVAINRLGEPGDSVDLDNQTNTRL